MKLFIEFSEETERSLKKKIVDDLERKGITGVDSNFKIKFRSPEWQLYKNLLCLV